MGFKTDYPADFLKVYRAYPDWPKGRTKKRLAYQKWQALKKDGWADADTDQLINEIELRKRRHEHWQPGNRYGPQALQTFLYQRAWEDDYPQKKRAAAPAGQPKPMTAEEEDANQRKLIRQLLQYGQTIDDLRRHGHRIPEGMEAELSGADHTSD